MNGIAMIGEQKSCPYEEEDYSHGTVLCIDGICMVCLDGRWEDKERVSRMDLSSEQKTEG